jgi:hypothetical protein
MRLARTSSPWQRSGCPDMACIALEELTELFGDTPP